ncbi:Protein of unknown function precursor [Flavobacterium indicum GPTSA100-9 = DSM 17447]|uniref:Secreted protein n=1 Tax=Flavobacterium indicum (strain DSM 17447 / CIP 109464 / GPTSA100-9) TaxID=1094466 RepID=H8XTT7_FLAIG|nr:hypothetical protein [Flavobacterium indicum]CCG53667.1 Protein of unknown function precursor [Flavobacterium indicum GPTSA100-9 = DSM 17447]
MKNLVIALLIALVSTTTFAQKGKTATSSSSLASFENLKAEIISEGGKQKLAIIIDNAGKKENVILKELTTKDKAQQPTNFKISSFTVSGVKLYHFTYTENIKTETKLKKENALVTTNEIWDFSSTKVKILGNIQTVSNIKEIKQLGKSAATETVEKTRREGFEFTLTKDYEVHLSTKNQLNKYKFNPQTRRYDPKK